MNENKSVIEIDIPTFSEWISIAKIQLAPDSPRTLEQLYDDIFYKQEVSIITEDGEVKRYGRVATIDVYYKVGEVKYKLHEKRFKLKPGRTLSEFLAGNIDAATSSAARPTKNSISERMKLNGEDPKDATIRALHEELFSSVESSYDLEILTATILEHLHIGEPVKVKRSGDAKGNSYQGIPSILDEYPSEITFTPEMQVPIQIVNGIPQRLYEYDNLKGYINLFEWKVVNMSV
jgi:hypothetical protein